MHPIANHPDARRAFTLVELISLIVLVAIMAAVVVPSVGTLPSRRGAAAARQLVRDLTYMRQQSLARGITTWAVFNTSSESYSMLVESTATPGRAAASSMIDPATGGPFSQSWTAGEFVGVDLVSVFVGSDSGTDLGFDWLGRPINWHGSVLTVQSAITLNGGHSVVVEPQTGAAWSLP